MEPSGCSRHSFVLSTSRLIGEPPWAACSQTAGRGALLVGHRAGGSEVSGSLHSRGRRGAGTAATLQIHPESLRNTSGTCCRGCPGRAGPRWPCSALPPRALGSAARSSAQPPPGPGMAEGEITTFSALTEKFNLPPGNYKKPKLLYCSNGGHFLRILPDGTVDGTRDRSDQHIQLQLSAESVGVVHIRSTQSGQYLAMDTNGLLYGSQLLGEECLFLERLEENHYNTYVSKVHADKNWFVGLKKNGNSKLGPRTHYGQKAILFLPLPVSPD